MRKLPLAFYNGIVILSLLLTCLSHNSFAQDLPTVNSIEIKGLRRIEEGAVKSKITQKTGEQLSTEKTGEDIKGIFRMGYFDDVRVDLEPFEGGLKLIYVVREKPTIIKVEFQGNKEIKDDKLQEKTTVTIGSIADTVLIQDNAGKIRLYYEGEGYWLAEVVPVLNRISDSEVSLTFQIKEGEKVKIKKITVEGNKELSEKKIKKAMKTSEWSIISIITSSGYYKQETMNADMEAIKDLYFNNGFIKVAVADPVVKLTEDRKGLAISIHISEGDQFRVSAIDIAGNKVFTEADIRGKITMTAGSLFNKETLKKDITAVTDLYTQNGYALANIYPDIASDDAARQIKLTYKIEEGDKYTIGRVEVSGNIRTRDKVIRREFRLDEGDVFDSAKLKRSYERINNLNFFETVELSPRPRAAEKKLDIDIKVKERATGSFSIGGGYSSVDKFIALIDVSQGNLFGKGQYVKLKAQLGGSSTFYELSYRDPWFMDRPISFTADIYKTDREYVDYKRKATGLGFGFGKNFGEYWGGNIYYKLEEVNIYDVSDDASDMIKEQLGTKITSSITPTITRDTRDNYLDPSRGSRNSVYVTFAGIGGSNAFIKGVIDSAWFFPIGSTTFSIRGRLGYATGIFGKELPLYERFYLGGIQTIRGLGFGEAGPRDENGNVIGGTSEIIINNEFIFPILSELKLKGVIFFDAGNSYDLDEPIGKLRYTAGTGFRWISPLGPIRVEWGYNIDKRPDESSSKVEFTFGSFF